MKMFKLSKFFRPVNGILGVFLIGMFFTSVSFCATNEAPLSPKLKNKLLRIARITLEKYILENQTPQFRSIEKKLTKEQGVFVTLNIDHQLRGCIGYIAPIMPLYQAVVSNTISAAVKDPRFLPVTREEVSKIKIEISVLSVPQKMDDYKKIILGKHGIIIQKDGRGAVYLPQVAKEQGWNLDQTLSSLCQKAGLPDNAYTQGAEFYVFTAQVFGEH